MKNLLAGRGLIVVAVLLCALFNEAVGQQPALPAGRPVGTAENDANIDTANVYVGIKNPDPREPYCVLKDGAVLATLSVVVTVGDFGAVMRIIPAEAAASIKKGDFVYRKRDVAQLERVTPRPTPTPILAIRASASPTPIPPFSVEQARSPFVAFTPTPVAPPPVTALPPAPVVPALPPLEVGPAPTPVPPEEAGAIIVDNDTPGAVVQEPQMSWVKSTDSRTAYGNSSLTTILTNPQIIKATFLATIPQDGNYEIYLWWVASTERYRSKRVPVSVHTMDGDVNLTIDETANGGRFNSIGQFNLKAGERERIVTISNEGINKLDRGYVSADAVKIVYRGPVAK
jgi:hypothetical protein